MQTPHSFGGFNVDRVLVSEGALLHAKDEGEGLNLLGQIDELELYRLTVLVQVVQLKVLKVADENIAGKLMFFQAGEVFQRLLFGTF